MIKKLFYFAVRTVGDVATAFSSSLWCQGGWYLDGEIVGHRSPQKIKTKLSISKTGVIKKLLLPFYFTKAMGIAVDVLCLYFRNS